MADEATGVTGHPAQRGNCASISRVTSSPVTANSPSCIGTAGQTSTTVGTIIGRRR